MQSRHACGDQSQHMQWMLHASPIDQEEGDVERPFSGSPINLHFMHHKKKNIDIKFIEWHNYPIMACFYDVSYNCNKSN